MVEKSYWVVLCLDDSSMISVSLVNRVHALMEEVGDRISSEAHKLRSEGVSDDEQQTDDEEGDDTDDDKAAPAHNAGGFSGLSDQAFHQIMRDSVGSMLAPWGPSVPVEHGQVNGQQPALNITERDSPLLDGIPDSELDRLSQQYQASGSAGELYVPGGDSEGGRVEVDSDAERSTKRMRTNADAAAADGSPALAAIQRLGEPDSSGKPDRFD